MTIDSYPIVDNAKAAAWDHIGSLFWEAGRTSAKPSEAEIGLFLDGIPAGAHCAVVGASTKDLVEALISRGMRVTVLDFSERMVADLRAALPAGSCQVVRADITKPAAAALRGTVDFVLSDRLVNRFSGDEAVAGLAGMADLLAAGGQVRTSIKLGLYPMDERMIALGAERGSLAAFFDADAQIIDFGAAGDVLSDALVPHGEIDPARLLSWYRGRGKEQRFGHDDVLGLFARARAGSATLRVVSSAEFPQAPSTRMYVAELVAGSES